MIARRMARKAGPVASTSKVTVEQLRRPRRKPEQVKAAVKGWRSWFYSRVEASDKSPLASNPVSIDKKVYLQQRLALLSNAQLGQLLQLMDSRKDKAAGAYLWFLLCQLESRGQLDRLSDRQVSDLFRRLSPSYSPVAKKSVDANNDVLLRRFNFVLDLFDARRMPLGGAHLITIFRIFQNNRSAPAAIQFFSALRSRGMLDQLDNQTQCWILQKLLLTIQGWLRSYKKADALTQTDAERMRLTCDAIVKQLDERGASTATIKVVAMSVHRMTGRPKSLLRKALDSFKADLSLPTFAGPATTASAKETLTPAALNTLMLQFRDAGDASKAIATFETHAYESDRAAFNLGVVRSSNFSNLLNLATERHSPLLVAHYFDECLAASKQALKQQERKLENRLALELAPHTKNLGKPRVLLYSVHFSLRFNSKLFPNRPGTLRPLVTSLKDYQDALEAHRVFLSNRVLQGNLRSPESVPHKAIEKYQQIVEAQLALVASFVFRVETKLEQLRTVRWASKVAARQQEKQAKAEQLAAKEAQRQAEAEAAREQLGGATLGPAIVAQAEDTGSAGPEEGVVVEDDKTGSAIRLTLA